MRRLCHLQIVVLFACGLFLSIAPFQHRIEAQTPNTAPPSLSETPYRASPGDAQVKGERIDSTILPYIAQRTDGKLDQNPDSKTPQSDDKRAVFVGGPVVGRGLPYLSINAIPYELGNYLYRGTTIEVYFIRRAIPVLESWIPERCGATIFYQVAPDSPEALMALSPLGFSVLFVAPAEPWRCQLLGPLWNRISSFYQNLGRGEPPFPAIVETP